MDKLIGGGLSLKSVQGWLDHYESLHPVSDVVVNAGALTAVLQLARQALTIEEDGGWVACSERYPQDSEDVIVGWAGDAEVGIGWWDMGRWWHGDHEMFFTAPTHWRERPTPPQQQGAGDSDSSLGAETK